MVLRAGWDNRNWRSFILAKSCEKILHFPHVGETVLSNCPNCRRKTEIYELRRWNTYRCHPPQNSQNNLLPSFVSFFPGTLPIKMKPYHYDRTNTYRVNICFQALLNWTQETGLDSRFIPAVRRGTVPPRSFKRARVRVTNIHAMLEILSIILSSVILKTTALVMVTGLSGVQLGL